MTLECGLPFLAVPPKMALQNWHCPYAKSLIADGVAGTTYRFEQFLKEN